MKLSKEWAREVVRSDWSGSWRAKIWHFLCPGDPRRAVVDSFVMDYVQLANEDVPFLPGDLIAFRDYIIGELEAGIPRRGTASAKYRIYE